MSSSRSLITVLLAIGVVCCFCTPPASAAGTLIRLGSGTGSSAAADTGGMFNISSLVSEISPGMDPAPAATTAPPSMTAGADQPPRVSGVTPRASPPLTPSTPVSGEDTAGSRDAGTAMLAPPDTNTSGEEETAVPSSGWPGFSEGNLPVMMFPEQDEPELINLTAIADEENQTYAYNLVDKGIECYEAGNHKCAFESFETAHGILPQDANILYIQAQALSYQDRNDEALRSIEKAIASEPEAAELWYQKGIIQNNRGDYFASGASFDRASELAPGYEFPITDRFPISIIIKNAAAIILFLGFLSIGYFFYTREIRR
ncbi:MAG: tetratricopeptide repeat protein [Methanomicrobiales archaeon]|nr:tetratricopeptide repeat protein [Methanomicrobiales archaeon]